MAESIIQCEHCTKTYKSKSGYKKHVRNKHENPPVIQPLTSSSTDDASSAAGEVVIVSSQPPDAPYVFRYHDDVFLALQTKIEACEFKDNIRLLCNEQIVHWIIGHYEFLFHKRGLDQIQIKKEYNKKLKELEDAWGNEMRNKYFAKEKTGQWTTLVGERIASELYYLQGYSNKKPKRFEHFEPDLDCDQLIVEVKTQTYFTTGTAGEKILGVPFKYAAVPRIYKKDLQIICIAGAEKLGREQYKILPNTTAYCDMPCGQKSDPEQLALLEYWKTQKITFVGAADILKSIL